MLLNHRQALEFFRRDCYGVHAPATATNIFYLYHKNASQTPSSSRPARFHAVYSCARANAPEALPVPTPQ
jgi:hypothetical protein